MAESASQAASSASKPQIGEMEPVSIATEPLIGETELPGSNRFVESSEVEVKIRSGGPRLSTLLEISNDCCAESESSDEGPSICESSETSDQDAKAHSPSKSGSAAIPEENVDLDNGGKPQIPAKPAVKPKPEVKPKPPVAQKPVLLPKPMLLSKPDQPYPFSGLHAYFTLCHRLASVLRLCLASSHRFHWASFFSNSHLLLCLHVANVFMKVCWCTGAEVFLDA